MWNILPTNSKEDGGVAAVLDEPGEGVAQGFYHGTCAKVAATDARHHDSLAVGSENVGASLYLIEEGWCDGRG